MKTKLMIKLISTSFVAFFAILNLHAQDPRERNYMYPVLKPIHEPKPAIKGWANERVTEKFNRGLVAQQTAPQTIYLSWRLLSNDSPQITFNIYREETGGKVVRINIRPVSERPIC